MNQRQKVYASEWALPKTYNIMPNIKEANSRELIKEVERELVYVIGTSGVIEKVVSKNGLLEIEPNDGISRDSFGFAKYVNMVDDNWDYKFNQYDWNFNDYKNPPPTPKYDKDTNILETIWNKCEEYAELYPNDQYEWNIHMSSGWTRRRKYIDENGETYYSGNYSITLEISKPVIENNSTWNDKLARASVTYAHIENKNRLSVDELEKITRRNVKSKVFNDFFYKKYFRSCKINLVNSYQGSSWYSGYEINLKKWATDMTLLHELAHQGKGCNQDHNKYFTSQMLMLVGRFLGHKVQIDLEEEYRKRGVDWIGIFNHSEQCLKDLGITDEVMLRRSKGIRQCATGTTRMTSKFENHLTRKVASRRY